MAIRNAQVYVGTSPAKLTSNPTDHRAGSAIAITAPTGADMYIGAADVNTLNGFKLPAGTTISIDLQAGEHVYGVLATGSGAAGVLETGV